MNTNNLKTRLSDATLRIRHSLERLIEWGILALVGAGFSLPYLNMDENFTLPGVELQVHLSSIKFFTDWLNGKANFPLWNPAFGLGRSWIADPFLFAFNPFASIPMWLWGWNNGSKIAVAIHFLIAGFGMWVVAKLLGFHWPTRLWVGMLYMMSGGLVSHLYAGQVQLTFSLAWLPWSFAGLLWVWQRRSYLSAAVASLAQAVFFFSGNLYYQAYAAFCYLIIVIVLVVEWQPLRVDRPGLWKLVVMGILSVGLISIQFLPLVAARNDIANMGGYAKDERDFLGSQKPVNSLLNYIVSDRSFIESPTLDKIPYLQESYRYIGISPFIFLLLIIPAFQRSDHKREIAAIALCFLLMVCWTGVKYTFVSDLYHNLPYLNQFRFPGRALSVGAMFVILLGGFGLEELLVRINSISTELFIKDGRSEPVLSLSARVLLFCLVVVGVGAAVRDVYVSNLEITDLETVPLLTVEEGFQWLRTQEAGAYTFGVYTNDSISVRLGMTAIEDGFRLTSIVDGWRPAGAPAGFGRLDSVAMEPEYWFLWDFDILDQPGARVVHKIGTLHIWKNPTFPFAFTVPAGRLDVEPFALTPSDVQQVISYSREGSNRILVETNTRESVVLVVGEAWFSGWNVWVDGSRANLASISNLICVPLPAGAHSVIFEYAPAIFKIGAALSLMTVVAILVILFKEFLWARRRNGS